LPAGLPDTPFRRRLPGFNRGGNFLFPFLLCRLGALGAGLVRQLAHGVLFPPAALHHQ
jgi:hypothetical protein